MIKNFKIFVVLMLVFVLIGSTYAFAAANDMTAVESSGAGYGASVVSGYTISDLVYDLEADDKTQIALITFVATPTAGADLPAGDASVYINTDTPGTKVWTDWLCTATPGAGHSDVSCVDADHTVLSILSFDVTITSTVDP